MNAAILEADYQLGSADYIAANRRNALVTWRPLLWILPVCFAIGLYLAVVKDEIDNMPLIWSVLMAPYTAFAIFWLVPRRAQRIYSQTPSMQRPIHITLTPDHARLETATYSQTLPWIELHKWSETDGLFILYLNDAMIITLPKAQIGEAIVTYAKARLSEAGFVAPNKPRKP